MKKITLLLVMIGIVSVANAQYVFSPIAGPTNVAADNNPTIINLNDVTNTAGVPVSSSGSYDSFSITVDWVAGGGDPWSAEAEITFTTSAGSVNIDPPTTGGLNSGANTTLTFEGDLPNLYDPTIDGFIDLLLEQSFGGSDADWSNITVTLFESPTCIEPSAMVSSVVTSTGATLDWSTGDGETMWDVEYNGGTDFTPGNGEEEGSANATGSPSTTLSGLTPATEYFVYYRADCGGADGTSVWVGPFNFSTECVTFTAPYSEGFENGGTIPLCWTMDGGEDWFFDNDPGINHIGNDGVITGSTATNGYFAWCDSSGNDGPRTLTSPLVDISGLSNPALSFFEISDNEGNANSTLDVEVWDGAVWNDLGTYNTNTSGWELKILDLSGLTITGDVQARFIFSETVTGDFYDDIAIDDVTFDEAPSCFDPTFLTASNITATTAQLSWIQDGTAVQWNVEIVTAGTPPTQTPTDTGVANPFSASGLSPATDYEYYVQADCGGDLSGWAGPFAFTTECTTFAAPYTEGFENGGTIPLCWTMDGGEDWFFDNDPGINHIGNDGVITGSTATNGYFAWCDSSGDEGPRTLISPFVDVSSLTSPALSFYEISDNEGNANSTLDVEVWDGAAWNNLGTYNTNTNGWELKVIGLAGLTITGDVQARFIFSETVTGDFYDDIAIDDVTFDEAPDCIPPSSISVSNITGSSADINWIGTNGETSWEYVVSPAGTGEPTGPGTTVGSPSINETDLSFSSSYEIWVRADCGTDGFSEWAGPITFDTPIQTDFTLDCANDGPVTIDYCYENGGATSPVIFTFTSNDGTPLNLNFNSGFVENNWDELVVLDSDGNPFPGYDPADQNYGNGGNIGGLSFQSTGDNISFYINSDGSVSCESSTTGNLPQGINYTVSCATCINPQATYTVIDDCDNGDQFLIDVDVTSLGDASSLTISNNINSDTVPVTATGTYQVGPFPFLQDVIVTVSNDQDVNCVINSQPIQLLACPPDNDNCENATVAVVNSDENCTVVTPGSLLEANPSSTPIGSCSGDPDDDVWFQFVATDDTHLITLENIVGEFDDLDHGLYEGSCGSLTEIYCSADEASTTPTLVVGNTYYIRVFSGGSDDETTTFDLCIRPGLDNVIVDQSTYTVEQLVQDILIGGECAQISNITFSTGTNFGEENGIGYFSLDGDGIGFPFEEGLILTTGNANLASGPNTEALSDGSTAWPGDTDLENAVGITTTNNATIIEFDFVPLAQQISFDFLMASEEYNGGSFECTFSDAFAFLLTDSNGNTTNLAVLPNTNIPILVTNIHQANTSCGAENEQYFGGYIPENLPPISFDGRTTVFTAQSDVNIGETYTIKLVIADQSDSAFDSGVFLKAGSFDLGELNLGDDITIASGEADCLGEPIVLDTQAPNLEHVWLKNGILIDGETSSTLTVTEPDIYTALVIFSNECFLQDDIVVEFLEPPVITEDPSDLENCSATDETTFNLNDNDSVVLGNLNPSDYTVSYHLTEGDAENNVDPITDSPYINISNPQTVYVRVEDNVTSCFSVASFDLIATDPTHTAESVDFTICNTDGEATFDLFTHDSNILNGQEPSEFILSYHTSEIDAIDNQNSITDPIISSGETIFVRVESVNNPYCYVVTNFNLIVSEPSHTAESVDYIECGDGVEAEFDLENHAIDILNGQDALMFNVSYHSSETDANNDQNQLSNQYTSTGETIFVRVESIGNEGCYVTNSFELIVGTQPQASFDPQYDYEVCPNATVPVSIGIVPGNFSGEDVSVSWSLDGVPVAGQNGLTLDNVLVQGDYAAEVSFNDTGCTNTFEIFVEELESCVIPQGISPNNDGANDTFDLSSFAVTKLEIFNRNGTLVYSKTNYTDEWHGQTDDGEELPVGTYFYTMEYENGTKQRSAWVYLNR